jgi:manganese transport protein
MIGATIMPHNLYLHSAIIQTRKINRTPSGIRKAIKWSIIDSSIALNVALLINAAILVLAATVFFKTGRTDVGEIKQAHMLLSPLLGTSIASTLFAIALIASGQSSTVTGTLSGQIVMEGYLQLRINPVLRRLITRMIAVIPAIFFIIFWGENNIDKLLIFSQVILSLQLGFAIIPLIHFVSDKKTMNEFAIKKITQIAAWGAALLLITLNAKMITDEIRHYWTTSENYWIKILIIIALLSAIGLLLYIIFYPKLKKDIPLSSINIHPDHDAIMQIETPSYKKIGVALDFTENDHKIISAAIGQGGTNSEYLIIHIVESPSAVIHKENSSDYESEKDKEKMENLISQLSNKGINAKGIIGYQHTVSEIVRIVNEEKAALLVIGSHGHKGIKDFIYGSTINKVRHQLKIPIFIVNI